MSRGVFFNIIAVGIFSLSECLFFQYGTAGITAVADCRPAKPTFGRKRFAKHFYAHQRLATSSAATTTPIARAEPVAQKPQSKATVSVSTTTGDEVARIQDPYSTPPESFNDINVDARAALVNILCQPQGASSLDPISGSGVIIDPRGIILTNAHVAQYVLLSESSQVDLSCVIRTGSPAEAQWTAAVLYIPPVWVSEHASEILEQHPTGTGEHDYALLYITGSVNGNALPVKFPYLPVDTRPAIAFPGDQVLAASYPAEFVGGIAAEYDLYADSSVTAVQQFLTFESDTPDVLSLGGVIEAQAGSSGGAVVNAWGRLVGLIATTSSGTTTADRDLRAITLSYINTDLTAQSGFSLDTCSQVIRRLRVQEFNSTIAPELIQQYVKQLAPNQASQ